MPKPDFPAGPLLALCLFLIPFAVSWLLTAVLVRAAPRLGLVDHPGARKVHTRPTPRGGGLAIYAALVLAAALVPHRLGADGLRLLAAGGLLVVLGLVDDLRPLPWQLRLGVQTAIAAGILTQGPAAGWVLLGLALVWIVGLVNAFNMLDNMDALSAGVAGIAAGCFAALALLRQAGPPDWGPALPYLAFLGAVVGFLCFNRPPARIFMGDAGSTFLGLFLGARSLEGNPGGPAAGKDWAVALCVLAVPWYDMVSVVALRLWQGRSPFHADKQHLSHRLVAMGLRPTRSVAIIYLLAAASGLSGLLLDRLPGWEGALLGSQLAVWWLAVAAVEYVGHYPRRQSPVASEKDGGRRTEDGTVPPGSQPPGPSYPA